MIRAEQVQPIPELLRHQAESRADAPAFTDASRTITYRELYDRTGRLGGHLAGLVDGRGERGLILMSNRIEVAESYLALARASLVAVCVNPSAAQPEVAYQLDHSRARLVITDTAHRAMVESLLADRPDIALVIASDGSGPENDADPGGRALDYESLATSEPDRPAPDDFSLDETSFVLYTSGTTGRPKGVMLSQRSLLWVVATCWSPVFEFGPDDRLLSPLPLFHSYALDLCVLGVVATGASVYVMERFTTDRTLELLRGGGFTALAGVPTMFQYLLNGTSEAETFPDLQRCVSAGASMAASVNEAFEERFGVVLLDGYGITETSTMVIMNAPGSSRVPGSCGLPFPGVGIRLVEPTTGHDAEVDQEGEIWVSGPLVMQGYLDDPQATAAVLTDGWYHTGDLARRDANGFVTISGRTKELIIRGGENIYPAEVEAAVLTVPGVSDAAVVGRSHPELGEVPVAFVVAAPGKTVDLGSVQEVVGARLAPFKVPAEIHPIDVIPRTGSGKTKRFELVARLDRSGSAPVGSS